LVWAVLVASAGLDFTNGRRPLLPNTWPVLAPAAAASEPSTTGCGETFASFGAAGVAGAGIGVGFGGLAEVAGGRGVVPG